VSYSFHPDCGNDCNSFSLDASSGRITSNKGNFDSSLKAAYRLRILAKDGATALGSNVPNQGAQLGQINVYDICVYFLFSNGSFRSQLNFDFLCAVSCSARVYPVDCGSTLVTLLHAYFVNEQKWRLFELFLIPLSVITQDFVCMSSQHFVTNSYLLCFLNVFAGLFACFTKLSVSHIHALTRNTVSYDDTYSALSLETLNGRCNL